MVNIEQITSTLAKLPDEALQRYAMMHKDDPYIMSLAVSESKRRKEMRSAGQAQGMQPRPKVVDQAVSEMAERPAQQMAPMPEEQGIGALPAASQMDFADGGITGYAGGGEVERYNGMTGSVTGGLYDSAKSRLAAAQQRLYTYGLAQRQRDPAGFQAAQQALQAAQADFKNASQGYTAEVEAAGLNRPAFGAPVAQPQMPAAAQAPFAPPPEANLSGMDRRLMSGSQPNIPSLKTPLPPKVDPDLVVDPNRKPPAAGIPAAVAPEPKGDMVTRAKDLAGNLIDTRDQDLALGAFRNFTTERAAEMRENLAKRPKTKAMEGFEKSLKEEAAGEAGEKDEAKGMAIFKAGLAMMSGTSPNALVNIGKGAMAGAEEYSGALKDFKKAAKDRQRLFAEIEEKRRLQALGDYDAEAATDQKIADLQGKFQERILAFTEKTTGAKNEVAASLVKRELDAEDLRRRQAQSFAQQVSLRNMPTYEQGLNNQYIQQWLNKEENKGKTAVDAVMALGLLGNQPRAATPTDRRMSAQAILNDPDSSEEEKAGARMVIREVLGAPGAGGAGKFTVTAGGRTYTFPTQEAANKFKAEAGVK
jgi:hypothetical protein